MTTYQLKIGEYLKDEAVMEITSPAKTETVSVPEVKYAVNKKNLVATLAILESKKAAIQAEIDVNTAYLSEYDKLTTGLVENVDGVIKI